MDEILSPLFIPLNLENHIHLELSYDLGGSFKLIQRLVTLRIIFMKDGFTIGRMKMCCKVLS